MNISLISDIKTKYMGKNIQYYKEIDSTHTYAKNKYNELKNGEVIITDKQTSGIGTKGRSWYTGTGKNIAITIMIKPKFTISMISELTVKIAQSIKKSIYELYNYNLQIKEPNDLILNNKKIGGILTEVHTLGENIKYLIISIGFNVNEEEFCKETEMIATSLKKEFNKEFSREVIIKKILEDLEEVIEKI